MSFMIELYYKAPADADKEKDLILRSNKLGGHLTFREQPGAEGPQSVCLTFEFKTLSDAEAAAALFRREGQHVEGPVAYASE